MTPTPIELLRAASGRAPVVVETLGPADSGLITEAEQRLGFAFPTPYREFVGTVGAVRIGGRPVYGIGDSLDTRSGLNVVWHTEEARLHRGLARNYLVLSSWDDLTLEVARVADDDGNVIDGPVHEVLVEGDGERLAPDFTRWIKRMIDEVCEDAAT